MPVNYPFYKEFEYVKAQTGTFLCYYLKDDSELITNLLKIRDEKEKNAFRVTQILDLDYFEVKKMNKEYAKTYFHDRLLDVVTNHLRNVGYYCRKEIFLFKKIKDFKIKGHADILIYDKKTPNIIGEIKNYLSSEINGEVLFKYIKQILIYGYILGTNRAYLVINNPKKYKKVSVFYLHFNSINRKYIEDYLNVSLTIPEVKRIFKYY